MTTPKSYFVLIGGESCDSQGFNLDKREYLHTSLCFVAKAYDQLRSAGVPRDQIITIVQLQDYLRSPLLTDEDSYARKSTLQICSRLIEEGGADYDYEMVNSGTVFSVLLGLNCDKIKKVVPNDSRTKSLFFAIYSHGNSHPTLPPQDAILTAELERKKEEKRRQKEELASMIVEDKYPLGIFVEQGQEEEQQENNPRQLQQDRLEEQQDSSSEEEDSSAGGGFVARRRMPQEICPVSNEWFAHFPYPCPPHLIDNMYSIISTQGGHYNGHKEPYCQLYANQLAMIITRLFTPHPSCSDSFSNDDCQQNFHLSRPVVGLLNFCRSGGGLHFMKREGFKRVYQPEHWPVFLMSAAQDNKDALVGGLWDCYFECFSQQLRMTSPSTRSIPIAENRQSLCNQIRETTRRILAVDKKGDEHRCKKTRIEDMADSSYSFSSLYDLFLQAKTQYRQRNIYELYGHISHSAYTSVHCSFRSLLQPLLTCGECGSPDFNKIRQLQESLRLKKIYIYDTYNWGVEVDLVVVVKKSLLFIALPDYVCGELSGIDEINVTDVFGVGEVTSS